MHFMQEHQYLYSAFLWTVFKTKEYPPEEYEKYHGKSNTTKEGLGSIFKDFSKMPRTMKQLGLVQFFSWFALFGMWVFTTDTIATHIFGLPIEDKSSSAYREAQTWTGVIFGIYNLVSAGTHCSFLCLQKKSGEKKLTPFRCSLVGSTHLNLLCTK
jgi:maltose/moltooligosaccharide transporter